MDIMALIELLFVVAALGVVCWGVWRLMKFVPMPEPFRIILIVIAVLICLAVAWNLLVPLLGSIGGSGHLLRSREG